MKIFVTGGTGTIGFPVVQTLLARGHQVVGLARSKDSAEKLQSAGVEVITGELSKPESWIDQTQAVDALVHMGLGFCDDYGPIDLHFLNCFIFSRGGLPPLKFLMTGGTWLYGTTGDHLAVEGDTFDPPDAWAWFLQSHELAMKSSALDTIVVHPAMVWSTGGNCLGMLNDIRSGGPVGIHENADHRWSLVNDQDLAELYALVLEKGRVGEDYNAASQEGVCTGKLAADLCRAHGHHAWLDVVAIADTMRDEGARSEGYGLDQQMSGDKARRELGWQPKFDDILKAFTPSYTPSPELP